MSNDLIRYDLLVREALCGVVRKVLGEVARHGLPGDHHFYITFRTHAPGVRLSSRMRELYPEEMTIILQHQFEDLKVTDHAFEVGLSFKGVPEILLVPFDALSGFFDPSVQFSMKLEPQGEGSDDEKPTAGGVMPLDNKPQQPTLTTVPKGDAVVPRPAAVPAPRPVPAAAAAQGDEGNGVDAAEGGQGEAKVVSIDAFRKKP